MPQVTRRTLLKLGLGAGGTALAGCDRDPERIESPLRDTRRPVGEATWFATTCKLCPLECGMHARVKAGRLKKLEGNPACAATGGALCALGQAGPQVLYHPARMTHGRVRRSAGERPVEITPQTVGDELARLLDAIPRDRVLCVMPNNTGHINALAAELGWRAISFDPEQPASLADSATKCFGTDRLHYQIDQADFILSFDADLVCRTPAATALGNWKRKRNSEPGSRARIVHVGPRFSLTAASADRWLSIRPGSEGVLTLTLAASVAAARENSLIAAAFEEWTPQRAAHECDLPVESIQALIRRAVESQTAIAIPGSTLAHYPNGPQIAQAIGLLNRLWEAPVSFGFQPPLDKVRPPRGVSVRGMVEAIRESAATVILDIDIVSLCPEVKSALKPPTVYLTTREDATASQADLVIPLATFLESWDDAFPVSADATTASIVQPVVSPFAGLSAGDVLLDLLRRKTDREEQSYQEYLKRRWVRLCPKSENFDTFWARVSSDGQWTDLKPRPVQPTLPALESAMPQWNEPERRGEGLYLYVYPAPMTGSRRHADLPWLEERYDVLTGVAWSSPLELHPDTAQSLGFADGDFVSFTLGETLVGAPVVTYPGIRRDTAGLALGHAESRAVRVALSGEYNESGDPILSGHRITPRKNGHRPLAKASGAVGDRGRGFAVMYQPGVERSPFRSGRHQTE